METISIPIGSLNCKYPHQKYSMLVNAEVKNEFAIHKSFEILKGLTDYPLYTVTHIPSKGKLFQHNNKEICRKFLNEICELDWSCLNHNDCSEGCNYVHSKETGRELFPDFDKFMEIKYKYL